MKDLILLVADNNMLNIVEGLLPRYQSLGIRQINFSIFPHYEHDPGCLLTSHQFLLPLTQQYSHAVVMFDREGCGKEELDRTQLEAFVENNLQRFGWGDRAISIVLDPELEVWVWKDSPHVVNALGWAGSQISLYDWLKEQGFIHDNEICPQKPKEALEAALRKSKIPRSSSIYRRIAETVGLSKCDNPSFLKLKNSLQNWFPKNENQEEVI